MNSNSHSTGGDHEIAEYGGATLLRRYIYGRGMDEIIAMVDVAYGNAISYVHRNRMGSVIAISDGEGNVVKDDVYVYSPYGQSDTAANGGEVGFPFRYTGRRIDPETGGGYYYRARYYDPVMGRFLQTDPVGYGDQMNLYAYVHNDPLNYFDPGGRSSIKVRFKDQPIKVTVDEKKYTIPQAISGGHSGVVVINDKSGLTRYREFGRYNNTDGDVRGSVISDLEFDDKGIPTGKSLSNIFKDLTAIGKKAGSSNIDVEFQVGGDFTKMIDETKAWEDDTWHPLGSTCHSFCDSVVGAGGSDGPTVSGSLEDDNSDLINMIRSLFQGQGR